MTWTPLLTAALYQQLMGPELHELVAKTIGSIDFSDELLAALLKAATNYRRSCA